MTSGELLRARRLNHSLSQERLAIRAGTTQAAISRIERGLVSPGVDTLRNLLAALGEELHVEARRARRDHDPAHLAASMARTPQERLELAVNWNRLAGQIARAGAIARREA